MNQREKFEAWAKSKGLIQESHGMRSEGSHSATGWEAWQAAIAAQEPKQAMSDAARDVLAERCRQIEKEGFVPEDDDAYEFGELRSAALCYISGDTKSGWPWDKEWWKPTDDRLDLIKAGALIIAEIERLDRAALRAAGLEVA